jgi:hypothetical protein
MKFLRLIESHKHAEILDYVKTCKYLASYEERALIERGNHEEIMTYLTTHYLEHENFKALLERGNLNEIRFYISLHGIFIGNEEEELHPFLRNVANELVTSLLNAQSAVLICSIPSDEDEIAAYESLVIKSGDHCALRRYIIQSALPFQPKALKLFKTKGYATAEDLLIYKLRFEKS